MRLFRGFHDADGTPLDGEDVRSLDSGPTTCHLVRLTAHHPSRTRSQGTSMVGRVPRTRKREPRHGCGSEAFIDALPEGMETEIGEGDTD